MSIQLMAGWKQTFPDKKSQQRNVLRDKSHRDQGCVGGVVKNNISPSSFIIWQNGAYGRF